MHKYQETTGPDISPPGRAGPGHTSPPGRDKERAGPWVDTGSGGHV